MLHFFFKFCRCCSSFVRAVHYFWCYNFGVNKTDSSLLSFEWALDSLKHISHRPSLSSGQPIFDLDLQTVSVFRPNTIIKDYLKKIIDFPSESYFWILTLWIVVTTIKGQTWLPSWDLERVTVPSNDPQLSIFLVCGKTSFDCIRSRTLILVL